MENVFVIAAVVSVVFFIAKFMENKFVDKETAKPVKFIVRDTLLVYCSVVCGYFIIQQTNPIVHSGGKSPLVFTDNPEF
jgi:hypothetical protein